MLFLYWKTRRKAFFFGFFLKLALKLLGLLLKVSEVTTEHQQWQEIGQNSIIILFLAQSAKQNPWSKAEAL